MTNKKVLKWTNKMSGETGYVKSVLASKGHFVNTFDKNEAKVYTKQEKIDKELETLQKIGECDNNDFSCEEV